jgi:hypothetical protein
LAALPRLGPFVFTTLGERPVSGFTKAKDRLDLLIALSAGSNTDPTKFLNPTGARNEAVIEAVGHAPFRPDDVGRLLGIKAGASWPYARISSYRAGAAVAAEGDLDRVDGTAEWCMGIPHWMLHDLRRTAATGMGAAQRAAARRRQDAEARLRHDPRRCCRL